MESSPRSQSAASTTCESASNGDPTLVSAIPLIQIDGVWIDKVPDFKVNPSWEQSSY